MAEISHHPDFVSSLSQHPLICLYLPFFRQIIQVLIVSYSKKLTMMKKYICTVCNWIYDPMTGDPDSGIAPGTAFEDIPEDWVCPLCGVGKEDFEVVED